MLWVQSSSAGDEGRFLGLPQCDDWCRVFRQDHSHAASWRRQAAHLGHGRLVELGFFLCGSCVGRTLTLTLVTGEEMYRAMTRSFYRGAQACTLACCGMSPAHDSRVRSSGILCFDITNRQSFDSLPQWVKEFREECPDAVITLCGNKADLADKRRVDNTEAMEFVQRHGLSAYLEVSAKSNTNVLELFQHTADSAIVKGQRVDRRAM